MTRAKEMPIEFYHVVVNCEENDPVDYRCGGPYYLGYDFYITVTIPEAEAEKFIKKHMRKNKQKLIDLYSSREGKTAVSSKLWTIEMIEDCITKGYSK